MQLTILTAAFLDTALISSVLAAPTFSTTTALILDDTPGDLTGDDLKAWYECCGVVVNEQGRNCGSLAAGTGAQDGYYAAEITIQAPCENVGVQRRLNEVYCSTQPPATKFC
jgi:hypothetical protein